MAATGRVQEVDADDRRVRTGLEVEDVGQTEAERVAEEREAGVELQRRQHRVAGTVLSGLEPGRHQRGRERRFGTGVAVTQLVQVAGRIGEAHQRLDPALRAGLRIGAADLDTGGADRGDGGLEIRGIARGPARSDVAVGIAGQDQDAELALVELDVQTAARRGRGHRAHHLLGIVLPLRQVGAFGDDIGQRVDLGHGWGPVTVMARIIGTGPVSIFTRFDESDESLAAPCTLLHRGAGCTSTVLVRMGDAAATPGTEAVRAAHRAAP